ncbi:GGDEF domain-containing protein [Phytoactinopolyspora mesophila]|uniref:Diguanylate cyclase n=1 Tax=Phytoactinopolyspora mesophila TaxID=2650750 RepID=A0A7K3M2B7_9ACTN|nr:GGDEF domain-containing protein [Phytoactinopolyspora mesophila]NDL57443.1 diguanylate cyclase [Phytoactinopolyspora mesophila]
MSRAGRWCKGWALWGLPVPVRVLVVVVNILAITLAVITAFFAPVENVDLMRFALLAGCALGAIELTRHVERRRTFAHRPHVAYIDSTAVWMVAAVIVLPPVLASILVVTIRVVVWLRVKGRKAVPYRWIYSSSTVLLGVQAAILILAVGLRSYPGLPGGTFLVGLADLGVIMLAAAASWAVNFLLILAAVAAFNPQASVADLFSNFSEQILEAGAAALGILVAIVLVANPVAVPVVLVVLAAMHRGLLVSQYEHAARIDSKTGLATAGRWHDFAEDMLARARHHQTSLGVLIVDLDHFKSINDTYGHPFGDKALRAVADELRSEVRELDACGRWGGEEFAVVLPDVGTEDNVHRIAERIRLRIQSIFLDPPAGTGDAVNITASVGGVFHEADDTTSMDDLILAADSALYEAKNDGRNTVRLRSATVDDPGVAIPPAPDAANAADQAISE